MRNQILKRVTVILVLTLALSSVISSFVLMRNMLNENIDFMTQAIGVVDYSLNGGQPLEEQVRRMHDFGMREDTRITVIDRKRYGQCGDHGEPPGAQGNPGSA